MTGTFIIAIGNAKSLNDIRSPVLSKEVPAIHEGKNWSAG